MDPANSYDQEALRRLIGVATARISQGQGYVAERLRDIPLLKLQRLGKTAEAGEVPAFDGNFLAACVWLQISDEIKRRMEAMYTGVATAEEVIAPPSSPPEHSPW